MSVQRCASAPLAERVTTVTPADALRAALEDGDRVFIKGSNGSGACRVAATILNGFAADTDTNGGASHAA